MSLRSGQNYHEFWGSFATRYDLPNVVGAAVQKSFLEVGDYAWVTNELVVFRCLDATLGAAIWVAEPWNDSRRGIAPMIEDWISLTPAGLLGWSVANVGAGSSSQINNAAADADHVGIVESDTGGTAGGVSALHLGTDGIVTPAAGGLISVEATVQFPVLSTGAQEYISRLGLGDSLVAADHTDGIYFEYNRALAGDFWVCKTANGPPPGNRNIAITTIPIVAGTWYRLRTLATPASVLFFVNDALAATLLANIPTGSTQRYAPNLKIQKSVGGTTRTQLVDYFQMRSVTAQVR